MDFVSLVRSTRSNGVFEKKHVSDFIDFLDAPDWNAPVPPIRWLRKSAAPLGLAGHLSVGGIDVHIAVLPAGVFEWRGTFDGRILCLQLEEDDVGIINGLPHPGPTISIGGRSSRFFGHWRFPPNLLRAACAITVPAALVPAGWPPPDSTFVTLQADHLPMDALRGLLHDLVLVAADRPDDLRSAETTARWRDRLLDAIDRLVKAPGTKSTQRDKQLCDRFESVLERIEAVFPRKDAIEELVSSLGLSEKSLYNTVKQLSGMTPYNLIRIHRLLAARRAILRSPPGVLVKQCAIDSGYWHLGRFSKEYARYFGETPSETLRRRTRDAAAAPAPEKATVDD
jgi:AraC-like DNA-binding protein